MKERAIRKISGKDPVGGVIWAVALACIGPTPAIAHVEAGDLSSAHKYQSWPLVLRSQMLRLNDVEWRLRLATGANCPSPDSATGLTVDHISAYDPVEHPALQRDLAMTALPHIAAVASNSPAALTGIRPGDQIRSIDGLAPESLVGQESEGALLAEALMDWLSTRPAGQEIAMELQRGKQILRKVVTPVPLCSGRAVLKTDDTLDAYSDDHVLAITTGMIAFTDNDDELALIVGHELAHLALGHARQGSAKELRRIETAADLLGANIATCAGYDVVHGAAFWTRYGAHAAAHWSRASTHASPDQRRRVIEDAAPRFICPVSLPAKAWSEQQ